MSIRAVTAVFCATNLSERVDGIDPGNMDQEVQLSKAAAACLRTHGPRRFHASFGSHFVCGNSTGGHFLGSYTVTFETVDKAQEWAATLKARFAALGAWMEGAADFEQYVASIPGVTGQRAQYDCVGWSGQHPPHTACSLAELVAAYNSSDLANCQPLDAYLRRYSDIDTYHECLSIYHQSCTGLQRPDTMPTFIQEAQYGTLSAALSQEYLRYDYLARLLADAEPDGANGQTLREVSDQAAVLMTSYTERLHSAPYSEVRETFKALEAYLIRHKRRPATSAAQQALWDKGQALVDELWMADELEARLRAALPAAAPVKARQERLASRAGTVELVGAWTLAEGPDGNLSIKHSGRERLVLRADGAQPLLREGDAITLRSTRNGHRLSHRDRVGPLDNPAAFYNANQQEWERLTLELYPE